MCCAAIYHVGRVELTELQGGHRLPHDQLGGLGLETRLVCRTQQSRCRLENRMAVVQWIPLMLLGYSACYADGPGQTVARSGVGSIVSTDTVTQKSLHCNVGSARIEGRKTRDSYYGIKPVARISIKISMKIFQHIASWQCLASVKPDILDSFPRLDLGVNVSSSALGRRVAPALPLPLALSFGTCRAWATGAACANSISPNERFDKADEGRGDSDLVRSIYPRWISLKKLGNAERCIGDSMIYCHLKCLLRNAWPGGLVVGCQLTCSHNSVLHSAPESANRPTK